MNAILTGPRQAAVRAPRLQDLLACWLHRSRSRARLARLDARLLADLGLSREAANAEARKPFWVA